MMHERRTGFTLLEIILSIVAIGVLTGIVFVAIRPSSQLSAARNEQRRVKTNIIINVIYQYIRDNKGNVPPNLATTTCTQTTNEICQTGIATTTCASNNLIDLSFLTNNGGYLHAIPIDPNGGVNASGVGFNIVKTLNNKVEVCAPKAEDGVVIDIQR